MKQKNSRLIKESTKEGKSRVKASDLKAETKSTRVSLFGELEPIAEIHQSCPVMWFGGKMFRSCPVHTRLSAKQFFRDKRTVGKAETAA